MPRVKHDLVSRSLRLPRQLNVALEQAARRDGISANRLIVEAVRHRIARRPVVVSQEDLAALTREFEALAAREQPGGSSPTLERLYRRSFVEDANGAVAKE